MGGHRRYQFRCRRRSVTCDVPNFHNDYWPVASQRFLKTSQNKFFRGFSVDLDQIDLRRAEAGQYLIA